MKSVNATEQNFKDLINEALFTSHRKQFLHDFKNLCYHSQIKNMFTLPQVHPEAKVEVRWSAIRNPLTRHEHDERGLKVIYHPYLPAVVIKLDSSADMFERSGVTGGELLIALSNFYSAGYIEIHTLREDLPRSIMPVKPHQVLKAINALMG
jgi:hypothetical protein